MKMIDNDCTESNDQANKDGTVLTNTGGYVIQKIQYDDDDPFLQNTFELELGHCWYSSWGNRQTARR
jgi:hypothetical protein